MEITHNPWNKGLNKLTSSRVAQYAEKQSLTMRRKYATGEINPWAKGKKRSEEHKLHLSQSLRRGFSNGRVSWNKGKKMSEETKRRLSKSLKRSYANGRVQWKEGKRFVFRTEEEKRKMHRERVAKWNCANPEKAKAIWHKSNYKGRERRRQWRIKNRNHNLAVDRNWRQTHPRNIMEWSLKHDYGISLAQFELMKNIQGNKCGICRTMFDTRAVPCVDHSHEIERVRGLLCRPCNTGIAEFHDSPFLLQRAIEYLSNALDDETTTNSIMWNNLNAAEKAKIRQILFIKQEKCCAICQVVFNGRRAPHVDHNHVTDKIRGLLCRACNQGIGLFKDDVALIRAAKNYLESGGITEISSILESNPKPIVETVI